MLFLNRPMDGFSILCYEDQDISTIGRTAGTLMAPPQGAKAFDQQYVTMVILLGISSLVILVFYIYHEEIHHVVKKWKKTRSQINLEDQP